MFYGDGQKKPQTLEKRQKRLLRNEEGAYQGWMSEREGRAAMRLAGGFNRWL